MAVTHAKTEIATMMHLMGAAALLRFSWTRGGITASHAYPPTFLGKPRSASSVRSNFFSPIRFWNAAPQGLIPAKFEFGAFALSVARVTA